MTTQIVSMSIGVVYFISDFVGVGRIKEYCNGRVEVVTPASLAK